MVCRMKLTNLDMTGGETIMNTNNNGKSWFEDVSDYIQEASLQDKYLRRRKTTRSKKNRRSN